METKSVDKKFEDVLNATLPTDGERVHIKNLENDEETIEEEEEDPALNRGISNHTKNLIAHRYASCLVDDPVKSAKIMGCLKHIQNLTEREGRMYLETLSTTNMISLSNRSIDFVLDLFCTSLVNPTRPDCIARIKADPYIRSTISDKLAEVHVYLGSFSGALLFCLHALDSYYNFTVKANEPRVEDTDRFSSSFSHDVRGQVPVGENNSVNQNDPC